MDGASATARTGAVAAAIAPALFSQIPAMLDLRERAAAVRTYAELAPLEFEMARTYCALVGSVRFIGRPGGHSNTAHEYWLRAYHECCHRVLAEPSRRGVKNFELVAEPRASCEEEHVFGLMHACLRWLRPTEPEGHTMNTTVNRSEGPGIGYHPEERSQRSAALPIVIANLIRAGFLVDTGDVVPTPALVMRADGQPLCTHAACMEWKPFTDRRRDSLVRLDTCDVENAWGEATAQLQSDDAAVDEALGRLVGA